MSVIIHLASASGNAFAYVWEDEAGPAFEGPRWARILGAKDMGLALDGLFLVSPPRPGAPWKMDHWDADGSYSFCGNGSRAALAIPGAPSGDRVEVLSNGLTVVLRADDAGIGIRMPEGAEFGLRESGIDCPFPHAYGWIGNPQLVIEHPDVAGVDLTGFAPSFRHHAAFPEGANVNVLQVEADGLARIRSWERGVEGETLCCGTGCAVAGAWLAMRSGLMRWTLRPAGPDPVTVEVESLESGAWHGLWLSGPVRYAGALPTSLLAQPGGPRL